MRELFVLACLTAVLLVPWRAIAEETSDQDVLEALERGPEGDDEGTDEGLKEQAREAYRLGLALSEQGQLGSALGEFSRSLKLLPHPRTRYNVAYCELGMKRYTRARVHFREAATNPELDAVLVAQAKAYLAKIETQVGVVMVTGDPTTRLTIDGRPLIPDGDTFVANVAPVGDAAPLGRSPVTVVVDPGSHVVAWEHEDVQRSATIAVEPGGQLSVVLTLPSPSPSPSPSPLVEPPRTPKPSVVRRPLLPDADADAEGVSAYVIAGLSLTGVAVVGGAIAGGVALVRADDVNAQCAEGFCPRVAADDIEAANTWALGADVSFGLAGAFAAFTVVAWLIDANTDPQSAARLGPHGFHARF